MIGRTYTDCLLIFLRPNSLDLLLLIIPLYQRVQMTFYFICVVPLLPNLKGINRFPKDNYSHINRIFKLIRALRIVNTHFSTTTSMNYHISKVMNECTDNIHNDVARYFMFKKL